MNKKLLPIPAAIAVIALLAGCSSTATSSSSAATSSTDNSVVQVVASTNVWGSIAQAVGGDAVSVTSLITSSAQDPHEFQATARDQLAVSGAQLVISNGGGYDDFITTMLNASSNPSRAVINAVDVSGLDSASASPSATEAPFNEHVWYNFDAVTTVAKTIAADLETLAPAKKSDIDANLSAFTAKVDAQQARLTALAPSHAGTGVAITEPVPLYMLTAAGLVNKTPEAFSEAIEAGSDVSPLVLQQVKDLFTSKQVKFLAYNDQTVTSQTQAVLDAATAANIPVVGFSETLPDGTDYIGWMTTNVDNVQKALG